MIKKVPIHPNILTQVAERFAVAAEFPPDSTRYLLQSCEATVIPEHEDQRPFRIELCEFGLRRLGFYCSRAVAVGQLLTIIFDVPGIQKQVWQCQVTLVERLDQGHYHIRGDFVGNA